MRVRPVVLLVFWSACVLPCAAQQYKVEAGEMNMDGMPVTPAHICLGTEGTGHCFQLPDYRTGAPFGLAPLSRTVGKIDGQELILFKATFFGGGSGDLTGFALLVVRNGQFVNLLPKVQLTNESQYQVWDLPEISPYPVLATADFLHEPNKASNGGPQQAHFAPHLYNIRAFVYEPARGRYAQRMQYTTTEKYAALDDVDAIRVLDAEKPALLLKMKGEARH